MTFRGSLPLNPVLIQTKPPYNVQPHFFTAHFISTISSMPRFSKWPLPSQFSKTTFVSISHQSNACYMPNSSYPPSLHNSHILYKHNSKQFFCPWCVVSILLQLGTDVEGRHKYTECAAMGIQQGVVFQVGSG